MKITENIIKNKINVTSESFKIHEESSRITSSGNKIVVFSRETPIKVKISQQSISIKITEEKINFGIQVGIKGDKGDKGDAGEAGESGNLSAYTYKAGEIINGHKAVMINNNLVYFASNLELSHINKPIGISNNAGNIGEDITVYFYGEMEEVSWNWNIDLPIFIGTNGLLTQIPTTSGFSCIIATPITTTKIFIEKQEIFIL